MEIEQLSTKDVIKLYSASIKELKRRKIIRTNNVIGDMGVFYGLEPKGSNMPDIQKFEYVLICKFDEDYDLELILEIGWNAFLRNKHWHSRMQAWNLALTKKLQQEGRVVYKRNAGEQ